MLRRTEHPTGMDTTPHPEPGTSSPVVQAADGSTAASTRAPAASAHPTGYERAASGSGRGSPERNAVTVAGSAEGASGTPRRRRVWAATARELSNSVVPGGRGLGDDVGHQRVVGAAEHDASGGTGRGRRGSHHRRGDGVRAGVLHGVGEAGTGHRDGLVGGGEQVDQRTLVLAGGGALGRPDREARPGGGRGLDRRDGPDDGSIGFQLRTQRTEGGDAGGVAGHDDRVRAAPDGQPGRGENPLDDPFGRTGAPRHARRVQEQVQIGVRAHPAQPPRRGEQPEAGVDQRKAHHGRSLRGRSGPPAHAALREALRFGRPDPGARRGRPVRGARDRAARTRKEDQLWRRSGSW